MFELFPIEKPMHIKTSPKVINAKQVLQYAENMPKMSKTRDSVEI